MGNQKESIICITLFIHYFLYGFRAGNITVFKHMAGNCPLEWLSCAFVLT